MLLLLAFIVAAVIGQAVNVWVCIIVDRFAPQFSFMVFFVLYMTVFWVGWRIAIYVTEPDFIDSIRRRFARAGTS